VAEAADIVSVHLALAKDTRGLIGAGFFSRMKPGAMFINTARGEVVDYAALDLAVRERGLRVGLDVFPGEPASGTADFAVPLAALPNVYGTHHIGASTDQAQEAIAADTVRIVQTYLETGRVPNVVNLSRKTPATHVIVTRHQDRPGVLAHVFDRLREAGINVEETENIIFADAEAAVARISIIGEPPADVVAAIKSGNPHVLDVHVVAVH